MIIDGKAYVNSERLAYLLGWNDGNISIGVRRQKIAHLTKIKVGKEFYFLQSDVYKMVSEIEAKSRLLCDVQSLVMYILDNTDDTKREVALKLGFSKAHPNATMDTWLKNTTYTKVCARVLVLAKIHYPNLLYKFDEEFVA